MNPLSSRAQGIRPTLIRELRDKARPTSLDFGIGQPDLPVAEPVRQALVDAVDQGRAPYTHNLGVWETREAIAAHYAARSGAHAESLRADNVMVTCGVQEALAVAVLGLVEPETEVLVPDPGFPAYPNLVRMAGATPVPYVLDPNDDFRLVPEWVERAMSPQTSAIILNSPSNPTGAVHDADDLAAVVELCAERGVRWISDEIYEDYIYDGAHAGVLDYDPGLAGGVKLGGLSKSHHMMGWRMGWLVGPADWVDGLKPLHQHLVTCAPTPPQHAARVALAHHDELMGQTLEVFSRRRQLACELAGELPGVAFTDPQGAFYLFLDVRAYTEAAAAADGSPSASLALSEALLAQKDVVTIPGSGFGPAGEGFLRVAYTVGEDRIADGFERMGEFFADLESKGR